MNRIALLAAASLVALAAGPALADWPTPLLSVKGKAVRLRTLATRDVLYNQDRKDEGVAILSANFTCGSYSPTYNSAGADDFVVPKGQTWMVTEVDATGQYFNGDGFQFASGEDVHFYKDMDGKPGHQKGVFTYLKGADANGNFAIMLPGKGMKLGAGHYWLSVVADVDFPTAGEWGWELTGKIHGDAALWENPYGGLGTGCSTWTVLEDCVGYGGDFMFTLRGVVKGAETAKDRHFMTGAARSQGSR